MKKTDVQSADAQMLLRELNVTLMGILGHKGNPHAIDFYKRAGYLPCENYPPYENEADAVCLEKKLL